MATINWITGEKGGVGKSLFCRAFIEYYQSQNIAFKLIDADRTNPDVGLIYEPQNYRPFFEKKEPGSSVSSPSDDKKGNNPDNNNGSAGKKVTVALREKIVESDSEADNGA